MEDALLQFNWFLFSQAFVMLFAILDPIGNLPIFLSMTGSLSRSEKRVIIRKSCLVALVILVLFAYGGIYIFKLLGITLNDFKIISGIILLIFAVEYVLGRELGKYAAKTDEIAVFPLATPLLAGPGSISLVMVIVNPPFGPLTTIVVIALNIIVTWSTLFIGERLNRLLGRQGSMVISRIMGLLIGAIAVVFIREGIIGLIQSAGML